LPTIAVWYPASLSACGSNHSSVARQEDNLYDAISQQYYGQNFSNLSDWQQVVVIVVATASEVGQALGVTPALPQVGSNQYEVTVLAQDLASAYWSLQTDQHAQAVWTALGVTYYANSEAQSVQTDQINIATIIYNIAKLDPNFDTSFANIQRLFPLILGFPSSSLKPANSSLFATLQDPSGTSALGFSNEQHQQLSDDIALAYAMLTKAPPPPPVFQPHWSAWTSGGGGYSRASGNADTFTSRGALGAGGLSYYFTPNTFVGLALGGVDGPWSTASGASGHGDTFMVALYGRTQTGPLYLSGWLNAARDWQNSTRFAAGDQVVASYQTQSYGGRIESGYRYGVPVFGVTPYAAVQVQTFHTPGYSETDLAGGMQAISYNTANSTDTQSELGVRFDNSRSFADMILIIRARAAWAHDWVSGWSASALFQSAPGVGFTVSGITPPSNSALATLETELKLSPNWSVAAKFDGQFGGSWQTYVGTGTLRYTW
jgi:outer membrane autotransporter protein